MLILLTVLVSACAKTVKIDHEGQTKSGMLEEVPKWFVEKEGKKGFLNKKDKFYLYGVGVSTSPDLQLAMDKATMIAKADLADVMHGEMNKNANVFIQEIGAEGNKVINSKAESTIVNLIKQTKVQGYEQYDIAKANIRKNKCHSITDIGYDEFFIIPRSQLKVSDEEVNINSDMTTAKMKQQFLKNFKTKKVSRVLLNKFIERIA